MNRKQILSDVARKVRDLRIAAGLTQIELATKCGTKQPSISAIENGRNLPSVRLLGRIAAACGHELTIEFRDT